MQCRMRYRERWCQATKQYRWRCSTVRHSPATHVHHILQQVCGLVEAVHQGPGAGVDLAVDDDAAAGVGWWVGGKGRVCGERVLRQRERQQGTRRSTNTRVVVNAKQSIHRCPGAEASRAPSPAAAPHLSSSSKPRAEALSCLLRTPGTGTVKLPPASRHQVSPAGAGKQGQARGRRDI